jgi:DNA-binding transcriptional LysR family regulator
MDVRPVRHFLAAFEAGTFAAAAERLNISPQAVSKSMLRIEEELGVRLFERDGRRIRPTPYATLLLPHARTIVAEADRFRADLGDMLGGRKGRLRIGVGPSAAADVVARALLSLTAERPNLVLHVLAGTQERMSEDLIRGELDLFVALRQVDRIDPLIRVEELGQVDYVVVAGATHPLSGRGPISLDQLGAARWLIGANMGAVEANITESFRAAGVAPPRPEIETTSVIFTIATLEGGQHLAILPEMLVTRAIQEGRLIKLDINAPTWSRPLIVGTRVRGPKPHQVTVLIGKLQLEMAGKPVTAGDPAT